MGVFSREGVINQQLIITGYIGLKIFNVFSE